MAARELESSDADPEAARSVEAGHVFTPDLGLVDSDGYLSWLGCWRSDAASLLVADAPGAAAESATDPRDVPIADKAGVTVGMSMTEKQGGSDVRAGRSRVGARRDAERRRRALPEQQRAGEADPRCRFRGGGGGVRMSNEAI